MSKSQAYIKAGGIGMVVAAMCCFSPLLVITLGIVGLGDITGYLDNLFLPALFFFLGLLSYGMLLRKKEHLAWCNQKDLSEKGRP
jgi:mercuric ion transport protein